MIKVHNFPPMIIFDVLNVCNLHCSHCPQKEVVNSKGYRPIFLDLALFKKAIDEIAPHAVELVRFTGDGEPLLHKNIFEMIKYAKEHVKGKVNLTTNGLVLNGQISEKLLSLPVDYIDISIDAYTEETYNKIRQGGDYNKLMRNIQSLLKMRGEMRSPAKIMVNMINQDISRHEIDAFKEYWSSRVDFVLIRNLHTVNNYLNVSLRADGTKRYPCPHLYKRITIDFEGNIKFCAHDWFNNAIVGNLKSDSIEAIWRGDLYRSIRHSHENRDFHKVPLCGECQDWQSVPWDFGYDKIIKRLDKVD